MKKSVLFAAAIFTSSPVFATIADLFSVEQAVLTQPINGNSESHFPIESNVITIKCELNNCQTTVKADITIFPGDKLLDIEP